MPNAAQIVNSAISVAATAAITAKRFVGFDGATCGAGAKAVGVAYFDAASGEQISVYGQGNVVPMTAGGAISVGGKVTSDANGKAVAATTEAINGYAMTAAATDGDEILVLVV